jgi:hypothetical protein
MSIKQHKYSQNKLNNLLVTIFVITKFSSTTALIIYEILYMEDFNLQYTTYKKQLLTDY